MGKKKAICTQQVEITWSHLTMIHTNPDALQEKHESVIQRITDLEEELHLTREEEALHLA